MIQADDPSGGPEVHRDPISVLVVEDEALIRMVIADHLRDTGFEVTEARSADEAIQILGGAQKVDIVFSDVNLPGTMNGIDLALWLRSNQSSVLVMLTSGVGAQDMPPDIRGRIPMIMKPYDLDTVVHRLKILAAGSR
ncbi:MAG: response regulator [Ferrovibrio sp.]